MNQTLLGETGAGADARQLAPSWPGRCGGPSGTSWGQGKGAGKTLRGADQLFHQRDIIQHGMDMHC